MTPTTTKPRPAGPAAPPTNHATAATPAPSSNGKAKLGRHTPENTGARIVLTAVEGWGKTSAVAHVSNAAIVQVQGETGYETLLRAGRVPEVDYATATSWAELLTVVNDVASSQYGILGIDAMGGAERLCHEFVCQRDFKGDWGEKGFMGFMRGYEVSIAEWLKLLSALDRARQGDTNIVLLSHAKVATFRNPEGPDFDRYTSDVHHKTWAATHKWSDAVLFGKFVTIVDEVKSSKTGAKGKGIGGTERVLYCERRDMYDAKNRYGMPDEIDIQHDPATVWPTIAQYIEQGAK